MMKVKHSFLVFAAAFLMVMPAFAKTGVVYQRQDSLRIVSLLQQAKAMKKKPIPAITRKTQNITGTLGTVDQAAFSICAGVAWRGSATKRLSSSA